MADITTLLSHDAFEQFVLQHSRLTTKGELRLKSCPLWTQTGPCHNLSCRHNLFHETKHIRETEKALDIQHCILRVYDEWTLEEIAQAWGMTRENVRLIERDALIRVCGAIAGSARHFGFSKSQVKIALKLREELLDKKYKKAEQNRKSMEKARGTKMCVDENPDPGV